MSGASRARSCTPVAFVALSLLAPPFAGADFECDATPPVELSTAERQTLGAEGELYRLEIAEESEFKQGVAVAILETPAIRVYRVVTDNCEFEEFMPYVKESCVDADEEGLPVNYQRLNSWYTPEIRYRIRLENSWTEEAPAVGISAWTLVDGFDDLRESRGSWTIQGCDNGNSLVTYQVHTVPEGGLARAVTNLVTKGAMPKLIKQVRERVAERRYDSDSAAECPCP